MFDKKFLNKLTILYVEDDELARTQLSKILNRLFKEVIQAKNGLEGFEKFQDYRLHDKKIDLILSDINMPKMSGIEMLEKIREKDTETPVIFTTARSETEYLLKAISLNANHYALKPIDKEDVILRIQKACEKKYFEDLISQKAQELKEYLKIINNVATICKLDSEGNITYANSLFLEQSLYTKEEILEKNLSDVISNEVDKNLIEDLWNTVKEGETWKSDLKCIDKKENIFYIKSTIFKINNDDKEEFINIGFVSTNEVNEKREFHKKLMNSMKEKNIKVSQTENDLKLLQNKNKQYEQLLVNMQKELKKEKQKQVDVSSQVKYYENEILNVDDRITKNLRMKNTEIENLKKSITDHKKEKEDDLNTINRLSDELMNAKIEIEKLYEKVKIKEKRVDTLSELIDLRENQLRKFDESLLE